MVRSRKTGRWVSLAVLVGWALLVLTAVHDEPRSTDVAVDDVEYVEQAVEELLLERSRSRPQPGAQPPGTPPAPAAAPGATFGDELPRQPRTDVELRQQLESLGLPPARVDEVVAIAEPAVVLARRDGPGGRVPGGVSQVGGLPLLPPEEPWPTTVDGQDLSLVAQIDLDAAGGFLADRLPDRGVLQFWLELELGAGPPLPPDPVVRWWPDASVLELREDGHAGWGATPITVDFEPVLSVPLCGEMVFRRWPHADQERYCELPQPQVIDQLGGWPYEFQGDPAASIAIRAAGFLPEWVVPPDPFPEDGTMAERRAWLDHQNELVAVNTDVEDWRLVLQLATTPGDHMWADGGYVWFMGRADDLEAAAFDDIRGELASH